MAQTTCIMIVGVGGQGTLLASRVIGSALVSEGYDVKVSEVHGMSQRGGSVVTYVKYGDRVYSPVIDKGQADYILSFESLETARWLAYLKDGGTIISSDQRISPMPVITGAMAYPEDIFEKIRAKGSSIVTLDALSLAVRAGNSKSVNVVLLGVLSSIMRLPEQTWADAMAANVKPEFLELNKAAFELGRNVKIG